MTKENAVMIYRRALRCLGLLSVALLLVGCPLFPDSKSETASDEGEEEASGPGKNVMFIGMDISGSFMRTKYFDDSIEFMAHYLYGHLNGLGGMVRPRALFVGSIGGAKPDEPKTFFPIQDFEHRSVAEITAKLRSIFPKGKENPFTDYTAFFNQIAVTVRNRNLVLKPIDIIMLTDGVPDVSTKDRKPDYRSIRVDPLENLARNITLRVLYTSAVVGMNWQTQVPRKRVKVWTQDDRVMAGWRSPKIMLPGTPFEKQERFFNWVAENVDFKVRLQRVD